MKLSFPITVCYQGETFTANVTPSESMDPLVYDVNYLGKVIAIAPHPSETDDIIWVQHLTGQTNALLQAIDKAIEGAEM